MESRLAVRDGGAVWEEAGGELPQRWKHSLQGSGYRVCVPVKLTGVQCESLCTCARTHTHTHTHSHRFISWPHQLSISVLFIYSQDLNKTQQTAGGSHTQGQSQNHLTEHRVERESQTWWPQACKINRERSPPDRKQNQVQNRDSCVPETNHNGSLL